MGVFAMSEKTNMLKSRFGSTSPATKPSTWYLGLSTTEPVRNVSTGVIENVTEFTGAGYSRIAIANDDASWTVTDYEAATDGVYSWTPTATSTGAQPNWWVLFDASTGGNACYSAFVENGIAWVSGSIVYVSGILISLPDA